MLRVTRSQSPSAVVSVIPSVGLDDLLLGHPQVADGRLGVPTKLEMPVVILGHLQGVNRAFCGTICISEIRMMDLIGERDCGHENCAQRSNDNLIHGPLAVVNAISAVSASILDNPLNGHITEAVQG